MRFLFHACALAILWLSGCANRFTIHDKDFDACRTQCSVIDWSAKVGCEDPTNLSKGLRDWLAAMAESKRTIIASLPKGMCGCFTSTLAGDGRITNATVVYSNMPLVADQLMLELEDAPSVGPLPPEASCLIGETMPGAFAK